ncbi:hypothetical protein PL81_39535 [Streptomyces sp. RSD-27]|nr:hypothetical protein PL81_39535 [Streptomyces sp. RSD-27]
MLRRLRRLSFGDLTLGAISYRTRLHVSVPTLSRLFSGKTVPTRWSVEEVIRAIPTMDYESSNLVDEIRDQYEKAKEEQYRRRMAHRATYKHMGETLRAAESDQPSEFQEQELQELQELQAGLRFLMVSARLSVRRVADRIAIPKSTVSDALNQSRPPRPDIVAGIAQACGVDPQPWYNAAEKIGRVDSSAMPDPSDFIIRSAVARPANEIAELAISLRDSGRQEVATRLIEAAARSRPVQEVSAITIALLNHSSPRRENTAEASKAPPEMPAPRQEPGPIVRLMRRIAEA